jgi:anti-sigma B factor antagonist
MLASAAQLETTTRTYGSTLIVTMTGELELAVADELSHAVHRALARRPKILILDLSAVTFVDCAGIRGVLAAQRHVEAHSVQLSIIPPPEHVHRVFVLAGVASSLPFIPVGSPGR